MRFNYYVTIFAQRVGKIVLLLNGIQLGIENLMKWILDLIEKTFFNVGKFVTKCSNLVFYNI